jgi:hypothetical protein
MNKLMNTMIALYRGLVIHSIYMSRSQEITVAKAAGVMCTPRKMMIACTYRMDRCFMIVKVLGINVKKEKGISPLIFSR